MYEPNSIKEAKIILERRMALAEFLSDREVLWDAKSNALALRPGVTWGDARQLLGSHLGKDYPDFRYITNVDHFFPTNGKMIAPTWSIAPGPVKYGGTCVVSEAAYPLTSITYPTIGGERTVTISDAARRRRMNAISAIPGAMPKKVDPNDWLCSICYALSGNFKMTSKLVKWVTVMMWLHRIGDRFASAMIDMIRYNRDFLMRVTQHSDFHRSQMHETTWPHPSYFRVHDAGDFFSVRYFEAWCEIAEALPDIEFWANTRVWAVPALAKQMSSVHIPPNFTVRASELFMGQPPRRKSWPPHASTMVGYKPSRGKTNRFPASAMMCPVAEFEGATCQNSGKYAGYVGRGDINRRLPWVGGCRACWDAKNIPVIYMEH